MTDRIQIGPKKKLAFVCSGGATKAGAFHLGVALALQEQGFNFFGGFKTDSSNQPNPVENLEPLTISTYVGSSAGAIIACYLAAGYSLDNIFSSFLDEKLSDAEKTSFAPKLLPKLTYQKMFRLKRLLGTQQIRQLRQFQHAASHLLEGNWDALIEFKWLKMTGIFSTSGIEQYIREEVLPSNQFQDCLGDLFITATELNKPRKVIFAKKSYPSPPYDPTCHYVTDVTISDACAASTALPIIFSPYPIQSPDGALSYYIDGEIRDTLSTHVAADSGADLIIASYTHQPFSYQNNVGSLTEHGLSAILIQSIYLLIEQKINNHLFNRNAHKNAIEAVSKYCKSEGIPHSQREKICEILEVQLSHRKDVDYIYIHPSPTDTHLFFGEHFSLSPKKTSDIVKSGFRAAIEALRKYQFADRKKRHAIGTTQTGT
jgi:predicted acylesterase/phospholipase RssA